MRPSVLALAAVLSLGGVGHASTFRDKFAKAIAKAAASGDELTAGKTKGLCVCKESLSNNVPGALLAVGVSQVTCGIPQFDAAGNATVFTKCQDWLPLTK